MEKQITVHFLDNLVDMQEYAKMCGISSRGVQKRIKDGKVSSVKVDGIKYVDISTSLITKKIPYGYKHDGKVDTGGISLKGLVSISRIATKNRITARRFFKAILRGELRAVVLSDRYYVYSTDPAYSKVANPPPRKIIQRFFPKLPSQQ